jgi:hypothetical protein
MRKFGEKDFLTIQNWKKKVFSLFLLEQRCPTIFLRSPQLWQINMTFRHNSKNIAERTSSFKNCFLQGVFLFWHV